LQKKGLDVQAPEGQNLLVQGEENYRKWRNGGIFPFTAYGLPRGGPDGEKRKLLNPRTTDGVRRKIKKTTWYPH